MDVIQLIITVIGFVGLVIYQHYKIKTLQDQNTAQGELLQNIKGFSDIVTNLLKFRSDQYEKLIEKQKNIEVKEIQQEIEKKLKESHDKQAELMNGVISLVVALAEALFYISHHKRRSIISEMQDSNSKTFFLERLTKYEEFDKQHQILSGEVFLDILESCSAEAPKGNEE